MQPEATEGEAWADNSDCRLSGLIAGSTGLLLGLCLPGTMRKGKGNNRQQVCTDARSVPSCGPAEQLDHSSNCTEPLANMTICPAASQVQAGVSWA